MKNMFFWQLGNYLSEIIKHEPVLIGITHMNNEIDNIDNSLTE